MREDELSKQLAEVRSSLYIAEKAARGKSGRASTGELLFFRLPAKCFVGVVDFLEVRRAARACTHARCHVAAAAMNRRVTVDAGAVHPGVRVNEPQPAGPRVVPPPTAHSRTCAHMPLLVCLRHACRFHYSPAVSRLHAARLCQRQASRAGVNAAGRYTTGPCRRRLRGVDAAQPVPARWPGRQDAPAAGERHATAEADRSAPATARGAVSRSLALATRLLSSP
jgi:hypothetical protein